MSLKHLRISSIACLSALVMAAPALAQHSTADPAPPVPPSVTIAPFRTMSLVAAAIADGVRFGIGDDDERQDRERAAADRAREESERDRERETRAYEQAREQMDQAKYDRAVERFSEVAAMKGTARRRRPVLEGVVAEQGRASAPRHSTPRDADKDYAKSRYLTQAQALEAEVRRDSGQPVDPDERDRRRPQAHGDQRAAELRSRPGDPVLEKLLRGHGVAASSSRSALFVLAQSNSPSAREVLKKIAKGNSTPELQSQAIDYLGHAGRTREPRDARRDLRRTSDVDVKRRILRAFMVAGEKDRLLSAAQTEQNADLRAEAVQQLGVMGAHDELWQLYQKETAVDVKKRIIQAMFVGGNVTRLIELAKSEKNPDLRRTAVRNLGIMGSKRTERRAGGDLRHRQGSGDPQARSSTGFHPEQRRGARRSRAQGTGPGDEEGHRAEAVRDGRGNPIVTAIHDGTPERKVGP